MHTLVLITTEFSATVHLMMSLVLFYMARRSVQFLSQAWIMLLICIMHSAGLYFLATHAAIPPLGLLHPILLIYLLACSYLLSIYPLGLTMPGYLQWGRMWGYAAPALALIFIYCIGAAVGSDLATVYDAPDIVDYLLSGDVLLRLAAMGLSAYYIVNIFRLPHRLVRRMQLPHNLIAYGSALGMVSLLFVVLTIRFSLLLLTVYLLLLTIVNLFLFFRILEPTVAAISYPDFRQVETPPTHAEISQSELNDFNEANLHRFERMEYVMQHDHPYLDSTFNRERLCRLVGFNRHMALQSLRSQGYNDIHEYISRYRVAALRRLIEQEAQSATRGTDLRTIAASVGFRSLVTAQTSFLRYESQPLNEFYAALTQQAPPATTEATVADPEATASPAEVEKAS